MMTVKLTRERVEYWRECILARDWREGARDELNALCDLALAALDGEEVWIFRSKIGEYTFIRNKSTAKVLQKEGHAVPRFKLVKCDE